MRPHHELDTLVDASDAKQAGLICTLVASVLQRVGRTSVNGSSFGITAKIVAVGKKKISEFF